MQVNVKVSSKLEICFTLWFERKANIIEKKPSNSIVNVVTLSIVLHVSCFKIFTFKSFKQTHFLD